MDECPPPPGKGREQPASKRQNSEDAMPQTCGHQETWTLGTCNLLKQPAMCAQRFLNTMVKIALHLDWENMWVTSGDMGEGPKPSRGRESSERSMLYTPKGYKQKWGRTETGGIWVVKSFVKPKRRGILKLFSRSFQKHFTLPRVGRQAPKSPHSVYAAASGCCSSLLEAWFSRRR